MSTRLIMRASALLLGIVGILATFLPQEMLARAGTLPVGYAVVLVQLAGALCFGFAMLNWMAQGSVMGGIYGRPVAIGNLAHFTIGALALVKAALAGERAPEIVVAAAIYAVFAVLFAWVAFGGPPARSVD